MEVKVLSNNLKESYKNFVIDNGILNQKSYYSIKEAFTKANLKRDKNSVKMPSAYELMTEMLFTNQQLQEEIINELKMNCVFVPNGIRTEMLTRWLAYFLCANAHFNETYKEILKYFIGLYVDSEKIQKRIQRLIKKKNNELQVLTDDI